MADPQIVEITISLATIGFALTIYFSGFLPGYLKPLREQSKLKAFVTIFLFCLTIGRLIACINLYIVSFNPIHWSFFFGTGIVLIFWHLYAVTPPKVPSDLLKIVKSKFHVYINNHGDAVMTRDQELVPLRNLYEIPETDFYSSGDLNEDDVTIEVHEDRGGRKIDCSIGEFTVGWLVNKLAKGEVLQKGKVYHRKTIMKAPGAFKDTVKDNFQLGVIYGTDYLEWTIEFQQPRRINPNRVFFLKLKDGGVVLDRPERLPAICDPVGERHIHCYYDAPKKGDHYGTFWEYLPSPDSQ